MSFGFVALGVGTVVAGGIAAKGAKDASKTQANAIKDASAISSEAADVARQDVFNLFNPALADFSRGIQGSIDALVGGQATPIQVAQQTPQISQQFRQPEILGTTTGTPSQFLGTTTGQEPARPVGLAPVPADQLDQRTGFLQSFKQSLQPSVQEPTTTQQIGQSSQLAQQRTGLEQIGALPAIASIQQFADIGQQAAQREAALSGALGPEAQQAAINQFVESPGQQFLRDRQEQSLLRNQAAIGGLGGGNVRTALQEQAFGIASTQQQQQLANLASLAGRGQQAATGIAGIRQQAGADVSNLLAQQAQGQANLRTTAGQLLSNIATGQGTAQAGFAQNIGTAQAAGQLGQASAIQQGVGQLANLAGQFTQQTPQQINPFLGVNSPQNRQQLLGATGQLGTSGGAGFGPAL